MTSEVEQRNASENIERVWYAGECHCGGVKFEAAASRNLM